MKQGDKAMLVPGRHNAKITGSASQRHRIQDVLRSMAEEVEIISVNYFTGNAKVRDARNKVFHCNQLDLRVFE